MPPCGERTGTIRQEAPPEEQLGAAQLKSRAAAGAAVLSARAALIYAVGIVTYLLLARLLDPRDFGLFALGGVVVTLGTYLGEAGVAAALIQRRDEPSRAELEAVSGFQIALALAIATAAAAIAAPFGEDGLVVALMAASLPLTVVRSPTIIVLERRLSYMVIAQADVVSAFAYYAWAVGAVALGAGVWGLASAIVVRALIGSAAMLVRGPLGFVRPRWSLELIRPLLGFGAKFQTTQLLQIAREQGLNVGVAAVGGIATLGVWNLAWRVLQIPNLMFLAIGRVAFPVMSRLLGVGEDPRGVIERSLRAIAILTGIVVAAAVGFAPALPGIVGGGWEDVPVVLLWSGVALILNAPITVATVGYLYAAEQPGVVARATLASAAVWFAVALPLVPSLGAPAVALGWIGAALVAAGLLWRATVARTGAAIAAHVGTPTALALVAVSAGWLAARQLTAPVPSGIVGAAVAETILLAGLALLNRDGLRDTRALITQALRGERRSGAA